MGVFTSVRAEDARKLLSLYDLGDFDAIEGIPAGSVNSNYALMLTPPRASGDDATVSGIRTVSSPSRVFLRVYEEQDAAGARAEASLLAHLASRGVKTPAPIPQRDGRTIAELAGKPAALFPWRDGSMRCQKSVTAEDAAKVGAELARVHAAGEGYPAPAGRFRAQDLKDRLVRIRTTADAPLAAEAPRLEERLDAWTAKRRPLPSGLVHGDLFRDNVLWHTAGPDVGEIAALLDFESASAGVLAYDLMVTVLSWSFGDAFEVDLARAMVAGYGRVRPLTGEEKDGLLAEGCLAALRFAITRITDYAMKAGIGPRVLKDWRRFDRRYEALVAMGSRGLREALGV